MENKIRVSVVAYLNAQPFIYGLENHPIRKKITLTKDIPSLCAKKLMENQVDIGLIPVAVIPLLQNAEILGNTCIGAKGKVASVLLCSQVPLEQIEKIYLDFHSRTSVTLVQVLCKFYWKVRPQFIPAPIDYIKQIDNTTAGVIIGDRTFEVKENYSYVYDLAETWYDFTNLPFVFAAWVSKIKLASNFLQEFEQALQFGLHNRDIVVKQQESKLDSPFDVANYLNQSIQYNLDEEKRKGMKLFFDYLKAL